MKAVKNTTTDRLVYREFPDFKKGYGIKNALALNLGMPDDLLEMTITQAEWDAELAKQFWETPPSIDARLSDLDRRLSDIERLNSPG